MRQALRFTLALVAGLALLTWGASVVVSRTTRAWFERDMLLRAELAVSGARETLVAHWAVGQQAELRKTLIELTHDERVLGAAACAADLGTARPHARLPRPALLRSPGPRGSPGHRLSCRELDHLGVGVLGAGGTGPRHRDPDRGGRPTPGFRDPRPRPELRRAARGDHAAVPGAGLRLPGPGRLDRHARRRAPLLAELEQRAAAPDPRRAAAGRVPALPEGRARPRRPPGLGARGGRPGRPLDAPAAQEHAEPAPPRRARRDRGEPRALHPRAHRGEARWRSCIPRAAS